MNKVFEDLERAIRKYDKELATSLAKRVIEQKLDPLRALEVMTKTVRQIGDGFERGEFWLPDLVGAGEAMSAASSIIEESCEKGKQRKTLGTVIAGTVYGDIHGIGIAIVIALLKAEGFKVYNLGVNVRPESFVEAVREYNANLLALSALMTTTAPEQKETIEMLIQSGLRDKAKVMVGGGGITEAFARNIGADGYGSTAPEAVKVARTLLRK